MGAQQGHFPFPSQLSSHSSSHRPWHKHWLVARPCSGPDVKFPQHPPHFLEAEGSSRGRASCTRRPGFRLQRPDPRVSPRDHYGTVPSQRVWRVFWGWLAMGREGKMSQMQSGSQEPRQGDKRILASWVHDYTSQPQFPPSIKMGIVIIPHRTALRIT